MRPHRGIRTEEHKLIHYTMEPPAFEMYDLKNDPHETNNLFGKHEHAKLQAHLLARMEALQQAVPKREAAV